MTVFAVGVHGLWPSSARGFSNDSRAYNPLSFARVPSPSTRLSRWLTSSSPSASSALLPAKNFPQLPRVSFLVTFLERAALLIHDCVVNIVDVMFTLLLLPLEKLGQDAPASFLKFTMGKPVQHPGIWQAIFLSLRRPDLFYRREVLQEANTLLLGCASNCDSLRAQSGWQSWLFPVLAVCLFAFFLSRLELISIWGCH